MFTLYAYQSSLWVVEVSILSWAGFVFLLFNLGLSNLGTVTCVRQSRSLVGERISAPLYPCGARKCARLRSNAVRILDRRVFLSPKINVTHITIANKLKQLRVLARYQGSRTSMSKPLLLFALGTTRLTGCSGESREEISLEVTGSAHAAETMWSEVS